MRNVEEPVTVEGDGLHSDTISTHPAFAEISLTRRSGQAHLYGSDFSHQHYISLRIGRSELRRGLSDDRYYGNRTPLVEIAMSEAQWARVVSSIGMQGTPCTLETFDGKAVPGLPAPKSRSEQFGKEADARTVRAMESIQKAIQAVQDNKKLSKAEKSAMISQMNAAHADIGGNRQFVADRFGEHMEEVVQAARIEVNAMAQQTARAMGLPQGSQVLALPAAAGECGRCGSLPGHRDQTCPACTDTDGNERQVLRQVD